MSTTETMAKIIEYAITETALIWAQPLNPTLENYLKQLSLLDINDSRTTVFAFINRDTGNFRDWVVRPNMNDDEMKLVAHDIAFYLCHGHVPNFEIKTLPSPHILIPSRLHFELFLLIIMFVFTAFFSFVYFLVI